MRIVRVTVFVGAVIAMSPSVAIAQDPPTLMVVADRHFKPAMFEQLEEALRDVVVFFTEQDYPFEEFRLVSDRGVLRTVTPMGDWPDLSRRGQWLRQAPPLPFIDPLQDSTAYIDRSAYRVRPDLSYQPANRRVSQGEVGFIFEIRAFLQPGQEQAAAALLGQMAALRARHELQDPTIVWVQESGSGGPGISIFFPAKDDVSFYTHGTQNAERLGEEQQALAREFRALCRRVENVHWTVRSDLNYRRAN